MSAGIRRMNIAGLPDDRLEFLRGLLVSGLATATKADAELIARSEAALADVRAEMDLRRREP